MANLELGKYKDQALNTESEFSPISPGEHLVCVDSITCSLSKRSGQPMVTVDYEVIGPNDPDKGRKIRFVHYAFASEIGISRFVALCYAVDPEITSIDYENQDEVSEKLEGQPLTIKTYNKDEEYNGRTHSRTKVSKHYALSRKSEDLLRETYGESLVPNSDIDESDIPF